MEASAPITIVDMEAGLEHLSRGTARHVGTLLVVLEPYYKALEIGRRAAELGSEIGITDIVAVANKLRDDEDRTAVREFARTHGLNIVAKEADDGHDQEETRQSLHELGGPHQAVIHDTAAQPGDAPDGNAGKCGGERTDQRNLERRRRAVYDGGEHVTAQVVGAKRVQPRRRLQRRGSDPERIDRRQPWRHRRHGGECAKNQPPDRAAS